VLIPRLRGDRIRWIFASSPHV